MTDTPTGTLPSTLPGRVPVTLPGRVPARLPRTPETKLTITLPGRVEMRFSPTTATATQLNSTQHSWLLERARSITVLSALHNVLPRALRALAFGTRRDTLPPGNQPDPIDDHRPRARPAGTTADHRAT